MCDIDNKPINKIVKLPSLQSKAPPRSGAPKHQEQQQQQHAEED